MPLKPVVDQAGFDKIECGRCGQCCTELYLSIDEEPGNPGGPIGLLQYYAYHEAKGHEDIAFDPVPFMEFVGQLIPTWHDDTQRFSYRCGHYSEDDEGLGKCNIYEKRPSMCHSFPNGKPVETFKDCTWFVDLVEFEVVQ